MALTRLDLTGDGTTTVYNVNFDLGYLRQEFVYVYLDGDSYTDQLSYTWINSTQIELNVAPANGVAFHIRRVVPRDKPVNDYEEGAILREDNLDDSFVQSIMILQEITDGYIVPDGNFKIDGDLDMLQHEIKNCIRLRGLDYAVSGSDAVPLQQLLDLLVENNFQSVVPIIQPRQTIVDGKSQYDAPHSKAASPASFFVFIDGVAQKPAVDFTVGTIGKIDLLGDLPVGADLDVTFFEPRTGQVPFTVNVKDYGAVGDGTTDDSDAIIEASATGLDVIFPEGKYLISKEIQTSVSWTFLDGARIVVDEGIANMIRIVPEYTKTTLGQGDVTIAEFTKYKNKLSKLDDYPNHFMVVDSTDLDFNRNHASGQTYTKNSVTLLGTNGKLVYPLTTTFHTISKIELSPTNIKRVIMTNLVVELRGTPTTPHNMIEVTRNCVDFVNTRYVDSTSNDGQIDLQSFIAISYAFDVNIDGITCDALSDGRQDYNYTVLTWKTLKLRINELRSFDGWAQLDGNYTRDVVVTNATIDRVGGHYSFWDCTFENIKASQSRCIDVSGGGRLDVRNLKIDLHPDFIAANELYAVAIRGDYAGEWDGDVLVDGVTVDARAVRSELVSETTFNVFSSFCDSSGAGFNYGRGTTVSKTVTVRNVRFHCNPEVFEKWVLRACVVGYVGAPASDAQYPERITVEDVEIVTKSTLHYHQIKALDWFGAVKPPTVEQHCSINIDGVNNNDMRIAGENPGTGIAGQVPTLYVESNARMHIDVTVSNCDWFKIYSNGHASSPTNIDMTNSRVYYIGGDFNNNMTFNGCRFASTRFEGTWKGSINGGWFEEYENVGGGYGVIGYPNKIEVNLSGVANVLIHTNTTMDTDIHNAYTIFEGSVAASYWQQPVRPVREERRSGAVGGNLSAVTPQFLGEEFLDNQAGFFNWWKATGLNTGDWKQIT